MREELAIRFSDEGDNHPIHFEITSDSNGFHMIDFICSTFNEKITFSYRVLDDVINALNRIKAHEKESND